VTRTLLRWAGGAALAVTMLAATCQTGPGNPAGDIARGIHDFLAQAQVPGTLFRPSQYFCGNQVKPAGPYTGSCKGLAQDDNGGIPATESTEVRGKLVVPPGPGDCDPAEVCSSVELDYGWTPYSDPSNVHALNTPEAVVQALTPHDLMQFSFTRAGGGLSPIAEAGGFHAWAGPPTIHLEANGFRVKKMNDEPNGAPLEATRPTDWTVVRNDGASLWPFDPMSPPTLTAAQGGAPAKGDYVRAVGTLWEDTYHSASPKVTEADKTAEQASAARAAKDCWHSGSLDKGTCAFNHPDECGRGWSEIHPVDVFQRVNEIKPAGIRRDVLELLALCGAGEVTYDIHVSTPRAGETIHFAEIVNTTFTVRPADVVDRSLTPIADGLRVHLKLNRSGLFPGDPKFFAGYHVWVAAP